MSKKRKSLNEKIANEFMELYNEQEFFRTNAFLAFPVKVISAEHYFRAGDTERATKGYSLCRDELAAFKIDRLAGATLMGTRIPEVLLERVINAISKFLEYKLKAINKVKYVGVQNYEDDFSIDVGKIEDLEKIAVFFERKNSPSIAIFSIYVIKLWLVFLERPETSSWNKLEIFNKDIVKLKSLLGNIEKEEQTFVGVARAYLFLFEQWKSSLEAEQP